MRLKNYQEDVVLRAIDIALEDQPALRSDRELVNDVAAYVLNRVPPKYIMSERGFLRLATEGLEHSANGSSLVNIIELMILVNKGVELVCTRRRREAPPDLNVATEPNGYYVHNYPQLIGRLVSEPTGEPVVGATVTLLADGQPIAPADSGWENPYRTNQSTGGYFSFWPAPFHSAHERETVPVQISVEHPEFDRLVVDRPVDTDGLFHRADQIQSDGIVNLGDLLLAPANGDR